MAIKQFTNIHEHTSYSLLDGLAKIEDKVHRAKELGQTSLGISDHGWMAGVVEFDIQCRKNDIHPVIGTELYISEGDHRERSGKNYHQTLFAMNQTGYKNLMKLSSEGYLNGFYRKPRVSKDFLAENSEGVICLSGCMASELSTLVLADNMEEATRLAKWYAYVFGDRYYMELQDHKLPDDARLIKGLLELSKEIGIQPVVTGDTHYVNREDANAHQVLLCVQTGSKLSNPAMNYGTQEFYLKSYDEMFSSFGHIPSALSNTNVIAERCDVTVGQDMIPLPHPPIVGGLDVQTHFKRLLYKGLIDKYGDPLPQPVIDRVKHELSVIQGAGFTEYFLLIHDIIRFCRERSIVYGVRGSVGGSIVAYGLNITSIDPLHYGLSFDRFLNAARLENPDIDFDVQDDRRSEIIEYIRNEYGDENVTQILALGTMGAKAVIRDVGRVMDIPLPDVDRIAKMIHTKNEDQSKVKLKDVLEKVPEFAQEAQKNKELFGYSSKLEGTFRQASTHAAGIIISSRPVIEDVPLYTAPKMNGVITTQFTMEYLDSIGLTKIDILGLTQLSIIAKCLEMINDPNLTFDTIPLDDEKTFTLISSGNTFGIFQLGDSGGMRRLVKNDQPKTLDDISALVALYRPGPLKFLDSYVKRHKGLEAVDYPHEAIKDALSSTYGIPVYQEQIMEMVSSIAGFTPGESDLVRKAMGKKQIEKMKTYKEEFIAGAKERGTPEVEARRLWDIINAFSGYGFGKSHSVAYGVMAVKSAYLKANYPQIYMTALLSAERENQEKVSEAIAECRRMNIVILNPDINESETGFALVNGAIRFGLSAIKGLGDGVADKIVSVRKERGRYKNYADFIRKHNTKVANKRVLEALSMAGAFDTLGERSTYVKNIDLVIKYIQDRTKFMKKGQLSFFSEDQYEVLRLPEAKPATRTERLEWEKSTVGTYLSENLLKVAEEKFVGTDIAPIADLDVDMEGELVRTGGIIMEVKEMTTRKGDKMARLKIGDVTGTVSIVVFPRQYKNFVQFLVTDNILTVTGKVQVYDEEVEILAERLGNLDIEDHKIQKEDENEMKIYVSMTPTGDRGKDNDTYVKLVSVFNAHPGEDKLIFRAVDPDGMVKPRLLPLKNDTVLFDSRLEDALMDVDPNIQITTRE